MKRTFSLWLKASFALFAVSVVGATVAAFSLASYEPGTQERCAELGKLLSSNQYTAADKEEYSKYCGQLPAMYPAASIYQSTPCEELKRIMESGQYTADQKAQWANCPQSVPAPQPLRTCDELKRLIESGNYSPYEKEQWANCEAGRVGPADPSYNCDEIKKIIDSGNYNADQKLLWLNCQQGYRPVPRPSITNGLSFQCQDLMATLKKYSQDPNSTVYQDTKAKYTKLCGGEAGGPAPAIEDQARKQCEELRATLEKLSADPSSQDYADTKAQYVKTCYRREQNARVQPTTTQRPVNFVREDDQCKQLRAKMNAMNNAGQTDSQDYADLKASFQKQCEKGNVVPPAGYEEEVLVNVDAYNNPFPDTDANEREGKAAAELYRRGVLGGFPDGEFKGDKPVNRAEAAKFLLLACGKDTQADYSGKFRDLMKGQWYVPYVEAAARLGIINGYADGTFRPANTVNRAEFSKMITLACQLPMDLDHSLFTDVKTEDWFATYAGAVQKYSLYPDSVVDNLFKPANLMSRSEVAIAIYQYLTNR